jgi:hypothetical protein
VTIKGSVNPFDPIAALDIATSFKRVELTTLTPYSGKFAGFRIRKGPEPRPALPDHQRPVEGGKQSSGRTIAAG